MTLSRQSDAASAAQLTLGGGEVPVASPAQPRPGAPLNAMQRELLLVVRHQGYIRTTQAGVIAHAHRNARELRRCIGSTGGEGCCRWAASDGGAALKRLVARGLLERAQRGIWVSAAAPPADVGLIVDLDAAQRRLRATVEVAL